MNSLLCAVHKLNLPNYDFRLRKTDDQVFIWDEVRKKDIVLTPEEWVRQNFIMYLNQHYQYPLSLMQVEGGLKYNSMQRRSDILCYNIHSKPALLVECKRPTVKIGQQVFDQIARYNMTLKVPFLAVTNGLEHYYCLIDHASKSYNFLEKLPTFTQLNSMQ